MSPITKTEVTTAHRLRAHVEHLATTIGPRNHRHKTLDTARDYIEGEFRAAGFEPVRRSYDVDGELASNVEVEVRGTQHPAKILVVGAHYDTCEDTPGADDNASGVAVVLELARRLRDAPLERSVRLVAFANEEPPYFWTDLMGSKVYAQAIAAEPVEVFGMLSIESVGYYSVERRSQSYPPPFSLLYPSTGDFIAFVGNLASRQLLKDALGIFRKHTSFPSEGLAAPGWIPGVGWSDHWSFWKQGVPALMVTDTALHRNPHYHKTTDTADRLDYARMARVLTGLEQVVRELASPSSTVATSPVSSGTVLR
ncbi:MAG: M20/M25/M40 family metallo-hydrolase [Deltaproteobacteria bacterium]|nr:M20/M25/M40 family metallo-hydrolase [Deltaproteobacteria bacterium]